MNYRIGIDGDGLTVGDFDCDVGVATLDWFAAQVKTLHNQGDGRMHAGDRALLVLQAPPPSGGFT